MKDTRRPIIRITELLVSMTEEEHAKAMPLLEELLTQRDAPTDSAIPEADNENPTC